MNDDTAPPPCAEPPEPETKETCPHCGDEFNNDYPRCDCCDNCADCCSCNYCEQGDHRTDESLCDRCDSCSDHCNCSHCSHCNRACGSTCDDCDCCESCCQCTYCPGCNCCTNDEWSCSNCNRCEDCCDCGSNERVVDLVARSLQWWTAGRKNYTNNPLRRHLACEIEVAEARTGTDIEHVCRRWRCSIAEDGSLPDSGFEILTAPASGDLFCKQITELGNAFANCDATVTVACGLHVHVDAHDLRWWDIRRLVLLYAKVEDGLFAIVPPSRQRGKFCHPCGQTFLDAISHDPKESKKKLLCSLYGSPSSQHVKQEKYQECRYRALNLHSWLFRGSVEFRHAAGTVEAHKIINWALLVGGIVDYAARHSDKEVTALTGAPLELLKQIAPTETARAWIDERYRKFN